MTKPSNFSISDEDLALASRDLDFFMRVFMPKAVPAPTPQALLDWDRDLLDPTIKKLSGIMPRAHSKSTRTCIGFPVQQTVFNPKGSDHFGMIIAEAADQSKAFLDAIQYNLAHNRAIRYVFGNLVGDKWNEDEIRTTNNVRWRALGTGQKIRGALAARETVTRPKIIIGDDIESETNSDTPEATAKIARWWMKAVEPAVADDGKLVMIGTLVNMRCMLQKLRRDTSWKVHFHQVIENGRPLWPERFPMSRINELRASYAARGMLDGFYQEYMNQPVADENRRFQIDKIGICDDEFVLHGGTLPCLLRDGKLVPLFVSIGQDLAVSEEDRADYSVTFVQGQDFEGNIYALDYKRWRQPDPELVIEPIFEFMDTYGASILGIETVQFQQAIANLFYKTSIKRGKYIGTNEYKPRTNKNARLSELIPVVRSGRLFRRSWMDEFVGELQTFPKGDSVDIVDAWWFANDSSQAPDVKEVVPVRVNPSRHEDYDSMGDRTWLSY